MASEISGLIVASRIVVVGLAAAVAVAGFVLGNGEEADPHTANAEARVVYVCPMHPKVVSTTPGDCPICRMALEPKAARHAMGADTHDQPEQAPSAVLVPASAEFRAFDAVSLAKPYPISLEMRASAWAEAPEQGSAIFYRDEAELIQAGEQGSFLSATPAPDGKPPGLSVRISADPAAPWDGRTMRVHFFVEGGKLAPGEVGTLKLATRLRTGLVVRSTAVLQSAEGPYVFVVAGDRRAMVKRPIQIGNVLYGYAAVTSGLREGESVAAKYTTSLAAELRQKGQVQL